MPDVAEVGAYRGGGSGSATTSGSTAIPTPSPPATAVEVREALRQLRDEDRRRELLTADRKQVVKVAELLRLAKFSDEAIDATVAAIVEHRGGDAARWTLDELHDVATDPTADVPALFRWRIRKGKHDPANDEKPTTDRANRKPRRSLHDGGASIRKANDEAAERRRAEDPSRLRDQVRGMLVDRKPHHEIAELTGAPIERVEAIAAEVNEERATVASCRSPKQVEVANVRAKVEADLRTAELCIENNRELPQPIVARLRDAGRWPL